MPLFYLDFGYTTTQSFEFWGLVILQIYQKIEAIDDGIQGRIKPFKSYKKYLEDWI